jgi:hypothetical protein
MSNMDKLSSQIPAVLAETSAHLRKMASRQVDLESENEALRHELRLTKLAHRMEERRLEPALDHKQKVAHLKDVPTEKLDALEQAVELSAGGVKLGSLEEAQDNVEGVHEEQGSAARYDALDSFIISGRAMG